MSQQTDERGGLGGNDWIDVETLVRAPRCHGLVGDSAAMRAVIESIERLAAYNGTVLLLGESGSGKELVAEALHRSGPFAAGPFVRFNCSNLMQNLAESQLFGHVRGAFTDAREDFAGCFRQANGGTLVLDEIGELPLRMQSKILRAVEYLEVQPVGSFDTFQLNLRLVASTNRDLRAMMKRGEFRDDLYYRLDAASIRIPPLRERLADTPALAAHFINHYNREFGMRVQWISRRALALIGAHQWPGNVRELAHTIERASLLCENDRIDVTDLPPEMVEEVILRLAAQNNPRRTRPHPSAGRYATLSLDDAMRAAIERSLKSTNGDCAKAARLLGISRPAIYRRMARYGIVGARWRG